MTTSPRGAQGTVEMGLDGSSTYIVKRGDTLAGVALRLGVTKSELKRANHMFGTISLMTGQQLKVHTRSASASMDGDAPSSIGHNNDGAPSMATVTPPGIPASSADTAAANVRKEAASGGHDNPQEEKWLEAPISPPVAEGGGGVPRSGGGVVGRREGGDHDGGAKEKSGDGGSSGMLFTPSHWGAGSAAEEVSAVPRLSDVSATSTGSATGSFRGMIRSIFTTSASSATPVDAHANINSGSRKSREVSFSSNPPAASCSPGGGGSGGDADAKLSTMTTSITPAAAAAAAAMDSNEHEDHEDSENYSDLEDELDRTRAASTAQLMLQYVKPSFWGLGGGGGAAAAVAPVAATPVEEDLHPPILGRAQGPEDGELEAASDRRRSRSFVEDESREDRNESGPIAQVMARPLGALHGYGHGDLSDLLSVPGGGAGPSAVPAKKVELVLPGLVAGGSTIVTHSTLARMELALPKHFRGYKWYLLYSSYRDGANWIQFFNRVKGEVPSYVVVENMQGEVFGGFAASAWSSTSKYYGTGESFLFSMQRVPPTEEAEAAATPQPASSVCDKPNNDKPANATTACSCEASTAACSSSTDTASTRLSTSSPPSEKNVTDQNDMACSSRSTFADDIAIEKSRSMSPPVPARKTNAAVSEARTGISAPREKEGSDAGSRDGVAAKVLMDGDVTSFSWTGMNTYFQYSDAGGIGMGGGGGSFGLFLGEDLLTGTTGKCDTFDNPPLCGKEAFDVSQVEVWGFTTASTEMGAKMERLRKTLRGKTTRPL